mmetsp:Transcript_129707/g.416054  ORF Transcript_129707/g.416054 Transcript_129707/m.416054 type:complete len:226 (+) Transcript_129707:203-880(+)
MCRPVPSAVRTSRHPPLGCPSRPARGRLLLQGHRNRRHCARGGSSRLQRRAGASVAAVAAAAAALQFAEEACRRSLAGPPRAVRRCPPPPLQCRCPAPPLSCKEGAAASCSELPRPRAAGCCNKRRPPSARSRPRWPARSPPSQRPAARRCVGTASPAMKRSARLPLSERQRMPLHRLPPSKRQSMLLNRAPAMSASKHPARVSKRRTAARPTGRRSGRCVRVLA